MLKGNSMYILLGLAIIVICICLLFISFLISNRKIKHISKECRCKNCTNFDKCQVRVDKCISVFIPKQVQEK